MTAKDEPTDQVKQVIVYRRDLGMRKGKIAAQCSHASLKVFLDRGTVHRTDPILAPPAYGTRWGGQRKSKLQPELSIPLDPAMEAWVTGKFAKIVLSVDTEEDLLRVHELAEEAGMPCALVVDAGKTEFSGIPTNTCVAIGPARVEDIDKITGPEGAVPTKLP